ncbi:hypothetical protein BHE74_00013850 [Ensete ventricosum]|nr:hypothetical protein BHE74_00013850 [Ensete ventricosum]
MPTSPTFSPRDVVISAVSLLVFVLLDLLDFILCYFYRFLDVILEGNPVPCYCQKRGREERSDGEGGGGGGGGGGEEVSETLHGRRNLFREMGFFPFWKAASAGEEERGELRSPRSPKPSNCTYTVREHLDMIEASVPCFDSTEEEASHSALNKLAERRVWPPLLFGSAVMSWYEHLGRTVCFVFCRNHSTWEWMMKLVTRRRRLLFGKSMEILESYGVETVGIAVAVVAVAAGAAYFFFGKKSKGETLRPFRG